jgi:hypothetical protein
MQEGWRHGVAHGADLLLQLALNPAVDRAGLDRLLGAVAAQVAPREHSYIYGESERLARPCCSPPSAVCTSPAEWNAWLLEVAAPTPFETGTRRLPAVPVSQGGTTACLYLRARL